MMPLRASMLACALRTGYILRVEALVEADGGVDLLHDCVGTGSEPAAPLLPVDMRDWLPDDHQVWLILDVVEQLDLSVLRARYALGGVGRRAYDPAMLLALLVYGYCQGVRSSRAIERACHTDVAFRVICAQDPPDHTRIARFRQAHLDVFDRSVHAGPAGLREGGVRPARIVAIDGTKIAANASIDANHERASTRRRWPR